MTTGELIFTVRRKTKLSREQLVVQLEIDQHYYISVARLKRLELDQTRKRLEDVMHICRQLGISLEQLSQCDDLQPPEE